MVHIPVSTPSPKNTDNACIRGVCIYTMDIVDYSFRFHASKDSTVEIGIVQELSLSDFGTVSHVHTNGG
jgi:hypothetical protein